MLKAKRFLPALFICAVMSAAAPAFAKSVFIVQLGSFNSEEEARKRWDEVKAQAPDAVASLKPKFAKITLMPDNYTVFRTQAGPIESKQSAQDICGRLSDKGAECLVAETALFVPNADVQMAQNETPAELPAPTVTAPVAEAPALPPALPAPTAETPTAKMAEATQAQPEAPAAMPENLPPLPMADTKPEPVMPKPLIKTIGNEPVENYYGDEPTLTQAKAEEEEDSGFFSWFKRKKKTDGADGAPAQQAKETVTDAAAETTRAAPVVTVAAAPPATLPAPEPMALPNAEAQSAPPARAAERQAPRETMAARALEENTAPSASPEQVRANKLKSAEVNVAEAIRVPVSENTEPTPFAAPRRFAPSPSPASYRALPSENTRDRTLWAQMSVFPSDQAAYGFWQEFQAAYPNLSKNVRVRVTRPLMNSGRTSSVSLRVGPYATAADIRNVCAAALEQGLRCNAVTDLGSSAAANAPRTRGTRGYHSSAYGGGASASLPGSWVMFGSFASERAAETAWAQLQSGNRDVLGRYPMNVSTPPRGSNVKPVYRLRVGPFMNGANAANVCSRLQRRGVECLTVNEN